MNEKKPKYSEITTVAGMVESVIGCKWSLGVLTAIRQGIVRPGTITRTMDGISTKVLNERLKKLTTFGILKRLNFAELPPRVEYHFTDFGERFLSIIDETVKVQREVDDGTIKIQ